MTELEAVKNELANLKQLWDQQCEHVHLACKLLGVDTDEVIGDSYTLVETAQRVGAAMRPNSVLDGSMRPQQAIDGAARPQQENGK